MGITPTGRLNSGSGMVEIEAIVHRATESYERGECDPAVDMLLSVLRRTGPEPRLICRLAELLIDSERFQDARDVLSKLPAATRDLRALELGALSSVNLGDGETAARAAAGILAENPQSAAAMIVLGKIAQRHGDAERAGEWFQRAAFADPACGEAFLQLGLLRLDQGARVEALDCFEQALQITPSSTAAALKYHAQALALQQVERAEGILREAARKRPCNRRLCFLRIDLLLRMGQAAAAMSAIETALAVFGIDDGLLKAALSVRGNLKTPEEICGGKDPHSVSLCMIVKNEERYLARCLVSVKPIVNEIVVLDTGSTDRTQDIARAFGAALYEHPWEDDFAKARNAALAKARGRWVLVLDADEVISESDHERFREIVRRHSGRPVAFSIRTRNYTSQMNVVGWQANTGRYAVEEAGTGWFPSDKVRLFPNDARTRFVQPVHEMVEPSLRENNIPIVSCELPVHHYGKLEEDLAQRKTRIYQAIECGKVMNTPDDPAALRELAIQSGQLGNHLEALELWRQILARRPGAAEAHVNMGTALFNLGRCAEAVRSAEEAIRIDPAMKEAHFNLALAELHRGHAERAAGILDRLLQGNPLYAAGQFLLAAVNGCTGEYRKAQTAIHPLRVTPLGAHLSVSFLDLARRLELNNQKEYARAVCGVAVQGGLADADLRAWMDERDGGDRSSVRSSDALLPDKNPGQGASG